MRTVELGEVCEVVSGATPKTGDAALWGGDIPWVTPKDLSDLDGMYIGSTPRTITERGLRSCSSTLLPARSVLLSSRAPIGHVAINTVPMATNQGFKSLIPKAGVVHPEYLAHWLKSSTETLQFLGNGATFKELPKSTVERIAFPLQPIEEQRRIAAILDKADELRALRRATAGMFVPLVESMLLDALASGRRASWPQVEVSAVAASTKNAIRTGPFGSQLLHSEFTDDGVPVLGIDNVVSNSFVWARPRHISEEKYQQLSRYTVHPGDVLVTIMGTCGRVAVAPADLPRSINTKHLCCITTDRDKCLPDYLRAALLFDPAVREQLGARERGAVMPGLNMQIIQQTRVTLPPLYVQEALAAALLQADSLRAAASRFALGLDEAVDSLAALAFSGGL